MQLFFRRSMNFSLYTSLEENGANPSTSTLQIQPSGIVTLSIGHLVLSTMHPIFVSYDNHKALLTQTNHLAHVPVGEGTKKM